MGKLDAPLTQDEFPKSVAEIYSLIGWGPYQVRLFMIAGLGFCADAIETGLISQLNTEVPKTWPDVPITVLAATVFAGELLGCAVWGPMADRIGRRKAFLFANVALCGFGVASAFAPDFYTFVVLRGLVGVSIGGIIIPFDNLAESVEEKYTVSVTFSLNYFWSFGSLFVSVIAAAVIPASFGTMDSWRVLTVLCALPIFMACLGYFVIEESPLWLQDVGRDDEALEVLSRIAKTNGKDISGVELLAYERESEPNCAEVVSKRFRMRTLGLGIVWAGGVLGYYGASLAGPAIFGEDNGSTNYPALIFGTSGEIVGVIIAVTLSQKIGYMRTMGAFYLTAAFFTASIMGLNVLPVPILAACDFVLRACLMGGNSCMYGATPLAYPTHIRGTAGGFHYAVGRLGAIIAALFVPTGDWQPFASPGCNSIGNNSTGINSTGINSTADAFNEPTCGPTFTMSILQIQLVLYVIANLGAGFASLAFGKDFVDHEQGDELKNDMSASVMSKRSSSLIKKQSRRLN